MDGGVSQDRVRIPPGDSNFRCLVPMRRAVVGDPEDTPGGTVRFLLAAGVAIHPTIREI